MGLKWSDVKDVELQDMMNIPEGKPIWSREIITPFPEGTLIRLKGTARTFVIQEGRKCYIPNAETFKSLGYSWDQVKEVDQVTLNSILTGIPIQSVKPPSKNIPPGQPPPIIRPPQFPPPPPIKPQPYKTSPQSQSQFSFPDGTLIKGSGSYIYLIQNGVRRLIPDMQTFNAMGFNFNKVTILGNQKLENVL